MPVHIITELLNGAVSPFSLSSASICVPRLAVSLGLSLTYFLKCSGLVQGAKDRKQFVFVGEDSFSTGLVTWTIPQWVQASTGEVWKAVSLVLKSDFTWIGSSPSAFGDGRQTLPKSRVVSVWVQVPFFTDYRGRIRWKHFFNTQCLKLDHSNLG